MEKPPATHCTAACPRNTPHRPRQIACGRAHREPQTPTPLPSATVCPPILHTRPHRPTKPAPPDDSLSPEGCWTAPVDAASPPPASMSTIGGCPRGCPAAHWVV